MDSVLRSLAIYFVLLLIFRVAGTRTLAQITTFDFVLLLVIGEATQQALLGNDFSLTNAFVIVVTLIGVDVLLSMWKQKSARAARWLEGTPLVLVEDGRPLHDRMDRARVDESDILSAARELQGLERMDQIKYAVLERSGGITVVPRQE